MADVQQPDERQQQRRQQADGVDPETTAAGRTATDHHLHLNRSNPSLAGAPSVSVWLQVPRAELRAFEDVDG